MTESFDGWNQVLWEKRQEKIGCKILSLYVKKHLKCIELPFGRGNGWVESLRVLIREASKDGVMVRVCYREPGWGR